MMPPAPLRTSMRLMPLWAAILLLAVTTVFGLFAMLSYWHDGHPDWRGWLAGGPIFALLNYGALVFVLTRAWVEVDGEGITVRYTSLPVGAPARHFARKEITALTLDYLSMPKEGAYWRTGIVLRDGRHIFLPERFSKEPAARARMLDLNTALTGGIHAPLPIESAFSAKRARDWRGAKVVLLWGGGFIAALVWGALVELYR